MPRHRFTQFNNVITRELSAPTLESPITLQRRIRNHALLARRAIYTDWSVLLPKPEVSFALLEVSADVVPEIDWLAEKLTLDSYLGCWALPLALEHDSKNRARYPTLSCARFGAKGELAHRFVFRRMFGPLTSDEHLDHLCRVHACCNPTHLEVVTHATNMLRGAAARKVVSGQQHLLGLEPEYTV